MPVFYKLKKRCRTALVGDKEMTKSFTPKKEGSRTPWRSQDETIDKLYFVVDKCIMHLFIAPPSTIFILEKKSCTIKNKYIHEWGKAWKLTGNKYSTQKVSFFQKGLNRTSSARKHIYVGCTKNSEDLYIGFMYWMIHFFFTYTIYKN